MAYLAKGNPYAMNMGVGMGPVGLHHHHAQVGGGGMPGLAGLAMPPSAMDPLHSAVGFPPGMDRPCKYDSIFLTIYLLRRSQSTLSISFGVYIKILFVSFFQGAMELAGSKDENGRRSLVANWTCWNLCSPRPAIRTSSCEKKWPSRSTCRNLVSR